MATTKGIYTTNRTYVALLRGTYAYVQTYITDPFFSYNSLLLSGDTTAIPFNADASTNKFNITVFGDTKAANFSPYTPGYYSAYFDGSGDYLSVPSNTAFAFGTGNFTVECFFNLSIPQSTRSMHLTDSTETNGLFLKLTSGNVSIGRTGTAEDSVFSYSFLINTWYHVAFSRSGTTVYCFVNGSLVGSTTNSINYAQGGYTIGTAGGAAQPFEGYISNLRMLKGTALYTAAFTPITTPLTAIANTSLLTCQENRFIDDSPNNFTITKNGDVSIKPSNPFLPPSSVTVNNLYSTYFDGTGDYLTVPYNSALNLGSATTWTMEYWVYFNAVSGTYTPISFVQAGDIRWAIEHAAATTSLLFNNTTAVTFTHPSTLTSNIWYHIAWVRDGTNVRLYINGVVSSTTSTNNLQSISSGPLNIGYNAVGGYEFYMNGSISNLRVVKGTAVYTGTFTPPTAPLTAITNTSLLTCQSSTLVDNSTNNFAITSTGQAQPIPVSPFTQTTTAVNTTYLGSGYLDGTGDYLSIPANAAFTFGTNDHTIEFYYYLPSTSLVSGYATQWKYSSSSTQQATNDYYFQIGTAGGSNVGLLLGGGGSWGVLIQPSISINTFVGVWTHIAWTRSGNTFRLFFNGVQVGTGTYAGSISAQSNPMFLGQEGAGSYAGGYYSNFRVNNGTALYTANFAPPLTPLTAVTNTSLLTLQNSQPHNNNTFLDNSSNKFLITRNGNSTQGTFSPYGGNWSNYFDGTGDYLSTTVTGQSPGTGSFTYECWFNITDNSSARYLWNTRSGDTSDGFDAQIASGSIYLTYTGAVIYNSAAIVSTNVWNHIAVVRSGSTWQVYLNGSSLVTFTNASNFTSTTLLVGSGPGGTSPCLGYISNFRYVNGTAVYTGNFTPSTTPLTAIANTSLLTCADNRLIDDSPNNFAITKNGDVSVQRFNPFSPVITTPITYSAYFDGTGDYLTVPGNSVFAFDTGDFTLEVWLYANSISTGTFDRICATSDYNGSGFDWTLNTSTSSLYLAGSAYSIGSITTKVWHHLVYTRSGSVIRGFLNGNLSSYTTGASQNISSVTQLNIGTGYSGTPLNGYLSNLRIIKGSIPSAYQTSSTTTGAQIFTSPTSPVTAIAGTSLLTCQSPTFIDNSTNNFAITAVGDSKPTTVNPFGFTNTASIYSPSTFGGSSYFDGTGDYLTVPRSTLCIPGASQNFTIEAWVYSERAAGVTAQQIMGFHASGSSSDWILYISASNYPIFYIDAIGTSITSSIIVNPYSWNHIAVVRKDTNTITLYVNGVAGGTATSTSTLTGSGANPLSIGSDYNGVNYVTKGYISNGRIVNGTALYTSNFVPPLAPVTAVANTSLLLNFTDAAVTDSSMMVNLESLGDAKITTANSRVGGSAMFFDGTGDYLSILTNPSLNCGTGNFTFECWVYISSRTLNYPAIFSNNNGSYSAGAIALTNSNADNGAYVDRFVLAVYDIATPTLVASSTNSLNTWYHLALVRNGTSLVMYRDGISVASTTISAAAIFDWGKLGCRIGGGNWDGAQSYFNGYIDDLRVTKYARYTSNFTPINSSHPLR